MKKLVSCLLAFCMLFGIAASAAEYTVQIDGKGFTKTGTWNSSGLKGADGSASIHTTEQGASVFYQVPFTAPSNAKVEFYNLAEGAAPGAKIVITYEGTKTQEITWDQNKQPVGWIDLGIYAFQGTAGEGVTFIKEMAGGYTRANDVKFTETTEAPRAMGGAQATPAPTGAVLVSAEKPALGTGGETIILTDQKGYGQSGEWVVSQLKGYEDNLSKWSKEDRATAYFNTPYTEAKRATVFFYNLKDSNSDPDMTVKVVCDKDKEFVVKVDGIKGENGFIELGTFQFTGAEGEGVYVVRTSGKAYTRVSAVKYVDQKDDAPLTSLEQPTPTPKPTIDPAALEGDDDLANIRLTGYSEPSGTWTTSGVYGFNSTGTRYAGEVGDMAKWDPGIDTSNTVKIYIYKIVYANNVTDALYQVHHSGQVTDVRVNLKEGESGWYELGTFDFNGKGDEYVTVTKDTPTEGEAYIRADAVKFIAVSNDEDINNFYKQVIIVDNDPPVYFVSVTFEDTEDHWAKNDVSIMAKRELVKGTGDTTFEPDSSISRAEFITLIDRILGLEEKEASFADAEGWYQGYLGAAQEAGLLEGLPVENNQILPDRSITREEMALLISNAGQVKGKPVSVPQTVKAVSAFADGASVAAWAKEACQYAVDNKIISGYEDNTFRPASNATRAEATVMLRRFLEQVLWAGPQDISHQWNLTFADEFDGDSLNWDVWEAENKENFWTAIKSSRYKDNVEVKDGNLYLHTKKNNPDPSNVWSCGYIWTKQFEQKYGYFEARYKYCEANGINNSFWLMTNGSTNGKNPGEHEIDINEGHYPNKSSHNFHGYDNNKKDRLDTGYKVDSIENFATEYHLFACEWTPEEIIYYVDGKEVHRQDITNTAAAETASVVRFSTAVGDFAGQISDEADGTSMVVDYVRVYQRADQYAQ